MAINILITLLIVSCSYGIYGLEWNYINGGDDWNFSMCNNNTSQQSPIRINSSNLRPSTPPFYLFPRFRDPIKMKYVNYGWTFRLEGDCGFIYTIEPFTIVHGMTFNIQYIEFHAPAEHTFDSNTYPLEMQIYMNYASGTAVPLLTQAAISFFFTVGDRSNAFLNQFLGKITENNTCLLYTSPSPRDLSTSRMPSSA
eukprot:TRINITY_DN1777_c0_g1_i1.p2 TRINITY_DN1777_c0_g1~~TRINITY_DN1777_c0_g1_i1.p2  ORF type:complete len:197 (+),score=47.14 TRINITY_DN1777_c0_g1_i1:1-591(+)